MGVNRILAPELDGLARSLTQALGDRALAARTLRLVADHAPDERLALASILRLTEHSTDSLTLTLDDREVARDLIFCLGSSEPVGAELYFAGTGWPDLFRAARAGGASSLKAAVKAPSLEGRGRHEVAEMLARFKRRMFLKIAVADLLDRTTVSETAAVMSALAEECIRAALAAAVGMMGAAAQEAGEFCVIAMGKLGAGELNLSSDIDLVYLFQPPEAAPGSQAAASRLARLVTELLAPGCFRVDLRLRPGGRNSPIAVSVGAAIAFYGSYGQTWERAALLRARPVAGALEVGAGLLAELDRFIYRRYLNFDTLRQLRLMKTRIEAELRSPRLIDRNIKLGRGGIRELEFIVQALSLIYGGRDPRLRERRTVAQLERLAALGYLPPARARRLSEAYRLLRDVEHKLQVEAGLQTHSLPPDQAGMRKLAARMGFGKAPEPVARFSALMDESRSLVATEFRGALAESEGRDESQASESAAAAWGHALEPRESAPLLKAIGFSRPEEATGHLKLLAEGPPHAPASPRRRELLEHLGPRLLEEMSRLADPDLALMNLAAFIAAVGARTSFLSLLEHNRDTRRVLLKLFGSSNYLSTIFIQHPEMLDTLVRSDLARLKRSRAVLRRELSGLLGACDDLESRLDAIRSFRHQEFLRIAIADLAGNLVLQEVARELSLVAEVVLGQALEVARDEVVRRRQLSVTPRLCVLAMGRLGASEMAYNSDLDLIFVFDDLGEAASGAGLVASRIAQKMIAILETRTPEGYAYKIDLRLRPSGNAGPLVTSLEGFRAYHRQSSATWERLALVRGRVIAGEPGLGKAVEAARREFVFGRGLNTAEVREIAAMRRRIEREISPENKTHLNLKHGPGGLIDVEFVAQMMALRYGAEIPGLRQRDTEGLLQAIADSGLMDRAEALSLLADYRFIALVESRLRIESDQPAWAVPRTPEHLAPLARRMGFDGADGGARLLEEIARRRRRIRTVFEETFSREARRTV